jgi:hypothetical protein
MLLLAIGFLGANAQRLFDEQRPLRSLPSGAILVCENHCYGDIGISSRGVNPHIRILAQFCLSL